MRKFITLVFILTGILVFSGFNTLAVKAITLEEIQVQIQQLLQAINSLKVQIQTMNQASPSIQPQPSTSSCPYVSLMYRGYSESATSETTELQKFLKQYPSIYPEGLVTGYFGRLTEAAVQRFQSQYGISVTGQVGPQTRDKLCSFWQGGTTQAPCGWCGNTCVRKTTGMYCADVMPPTGYECKEINGVCTVSSVVSTTTPFSSLPDLTITDLTCSPNNNIQLGQLTYCTITVKNNGSVDAPTHKLEAFVWGKSAYSVYGIVRAGQTEQATFSWQCAEAGDFTVKAVVDSENSIQESNENNNEKTISICCGGTCAGLPTSNLSDLTITSITADRTTLNVGETTRILATENNIGSASAGYHKTGIFEDNIETPLNYSETNALAPGYGFVLSANYTCYRTGAHTIQAIADYIHQVATGQVLESNENNNSKTITINCLSSTPVSTLSVTCVSSKTSNTFNVGESVSFFALPTGGSGIYPTAVWSGDVTGTGLSRIVSFSSAGVKTATVQVTDSQGRTATASCSVQVNSQTVSNLSVTCVSSKTSNTFNVGESVAFFALPTGGSSSYPTVVWSGDVTGTGLSRIVSFSSAGVKTATVQVTDSQGRTATASCSIQVNNQTVSNLSVTCVSSKTSNTFNVGESLALFALPTGGSGSYPTAVWSGDVTGTGLSRIVSFSSAGTKTITVQVTDSQGRTSQATCYVLITSPTTFLDAIQNTLAQLSNLVQKLAAALIELKR